MAEYKVYDENENEVKKGQELTDFRGDKAIFKGCYHPRKVCVKEKDLDCMEYYASVFNLTIKQ